MDISWQMSLCVTELRQRWDHASSLLKDDFTSALQPSPSETDTLSGTVLTVHLKEVSGLSVESLNIVK